LFIKKKRLATEDIKGLSFCISTNGAKVEKTLIEIASIKETMAKVSIPYEIILSGDVEAFSSISDLILIKTQEDAHNGLLAKLRNSAAENAKYDVLVFCDDDLIFSTTWAERLEEFSKVEPWEVLGNRILLPDGGRYWDRSTLNPHTMIDYEKESFPGTLYQTGCFWIVRKKVYDLHKWDSSIGYYAEKNGGINEDVEYSLRLQKNGIDLSFDKDNLIWHNDDSYCQVGNVCLKKELTNILEFLDNKKEFEDLVRKFA
jgi:glycosyltransferase involved in cell wall biosynthesis